MAFPHIHSAWRQPHRLAHSASCAGSTLRPGLSPPRTCRQPGGPPPRPPQPASTPIPALPACPLPWQRPQAPVPTPSARPSLWTPCAGRCLGRTACPPSRQAPQPAMPVTAAPVQTRTASLQLLLPPGRPEPTPSETPSLWTPGPSLPLPPQGLHPQSKPRPIRLPLCRCAGVCMLSLALKTCSMWWLASSGAALRVPGRQKYLLGSGPGVMHSSSTNVRAQGSLVRLVSVCQKQSASLHGQPHLSPAHML